MTYDIDYAHRSLGSYTPPVANILGGTPASKRARSVVSALLSTSAGLNAALAEARRYEDPNLSPEGLTEERAARGKTLAAAIQRRITTFSEPLTHALTDAEKAADAFRPKLDPTDIAQGNRIATAWQLTVKPLLDVGKAWDDIISTLDHDGLLAVQRFAPAHEAGKRDKFTQHEVPAVLEGIARMTDKRVIASAPEGPAREALQEYETVRRTHEAAQNSIAALTMIAKSTAEGNDYRLKEDLPLATMAVRREAFAVGANPSAMQAEAAAAA